MPLTQVQGQMLSGSNNTTTTIQSNGTTAITIDSSQNVGIGTASPLAKLQIKTATNVNGAFTTSGNDSTGVQLYGYNDSGASLIPVWANGSYLGFSTGNTERMRITSGGNLLVGTTSNPNNSQLVVNGQIATKNINGGLNTALNVTTGGAAGNFGVAGLVLVQAGIPNHAFWDLVLAQSFGTISVLGSATFGSPSTRTYSGNGAGGIQVSLSGGTSGTYTINYIQITGT